MIIKNIKEDGRKQKIILLIMVQQPQRVKNIEK